MDAVAEIFDGEKVITKAGETGKIASHNEKYITVVFNDRTTGFLVDAFEKGFLKYESPALQAAIEKEEQEKAQKIAQIQTKPGRCRRNYPAHTEESRFCRLPSAWIRPPSR